MSTIVTRSGKGSPLTHAEMDANVTNLNTDKLESTVTQDLTIKTSDGAILKLQTSHDTIADGDVLGAIEFSAPDESDGADGDARLVAASIVAEADDTFSDTVNKADLVVKLGKSEAAVERARFAHEGGLTLTGYDDDTNPDPSINLRRFSASPSTADFLGSVYFVGKNDADQNHHYAAIMAKSPNITDGSESGRLIFRVAENGQHAWSGSATDVITINADSLSFDASNGTSFGGHDISSVGEISTSTLRITSTTDLSLSSTTHAFQVGPSSGANIAMDGNEIMARNNGATSDLYLNNNGGLVRFGGDVTLQGDSYDAVWDKSANALKFGDLAKLTFGANDDLQISHVGDTWTYSSITNTNANGLLIRSNLTKIVNYGAESLEENLAVFTSNGSVELYYDGSKTFETASGGINVISSGSGGGILHLQNTDVAIQDGEVLGTIKFSAPSEGSGSDAILTSASIEAEADAAFSNNNNQTDLVFSLGSSEAATEKMRLHHEGNLSLGVNTDVSAEIGRAHIGYIGYADYAGFSHIDSNGTSTYALLQGSDGTTLLNCASGTGTYLRVGNADVAHIGDLGLYMYPNKSVVFEGSSTSSNETTLTVADPTADRTITLPDATGTVHLNNDSFGRTLLLSAFVSNSSSVAFNSTYITDTYNTYDVVFTNIHSASDNVALRCRMGDSDSAITSAAYSYIGQMRGTRGSDSSEIANYADNEETYMAVTPNDSDMYLGTSSTENFNCHLRFFNLRYTNRAKGFEILSGAYRTSDSYWASWYQGIGFDHDNFANKRNFISFFLSSGNFASGNVKLYGLNL